MEKFSVNWYLDFGNVQYIGQIVSRSDFSQNKIIDDSLCNYSDRDWVNSELALLGSWSQLRERGTIFVDYITYI